MNKAMSRRDMLTQVVPAAAFVGVGLNSAALLAQQADQPGENVVGRLLAAAYQNGQYALPPLPYAYEALEPHIDAKTMQLHHDKHHLAYVNGLNAAMKAIQTGNIDPTALPTVQRNLSFNGGGHILHTIFWATMAPNAGGAPQGPIADAINKSFGSFDAFKDYFTKVAAGVKGSGWALLSYEPLGDQLMVFEVNEHDTKLIAGSVPLLPLDVWEHAYYLKYQNVRADYIKAWWNVVNWSAVNGAYQWVRARYRPQQQ